MDEKATIFVIEKDRPNVMPYVFTKSQGIFLNFTRKNKNTNTKDRKASKDSQNKLKRKEKTEDDVNRSSVKSTIIGSTSAFLAALTITLASSAVQGLEQRWPDMELNIFRWVFMIIPLSVYFLCTKTSPSIPREKIPHVLFYGLLVSGEQVLFFTGVNFLPLGLMAAVFRTSLVTMAAFASRIIEKENLNIIRIAAIILGIFGIILMWQPEFIFGENDTGSDVEMIHMQTSSNVTQMESMNITPSLDDTTDTDVETVTISTSSNITNIPALQIKVLRRDEKNVTTDSMNAASSNQMTSSTLVPSLNDRKSLVPTENLSDNVKLYIGLAITISAAFLVVMQGVCMKRRQFMDYSVWKLMFWVGVTGIVWTSALSFALEDTVFIMDAEDLSLVASYAILASLHMYTFLYALNITSYFIVAIIMVSQIVFNLIAQYTVMAHIFPGQHNIIEIIGAMAVMMAAILPTAWEMFVANKRRKDKIRRESIYHRGKRLKRHSLEASLFTAYTVGVGQVKSTKFRVYA